jgi:prepilin-type N-terminal cleavage/methylation domain-containing protein
MQKQLGFTLTELMIVLIVALGAGGWIANVVKLIAHLDDAITGMFVARIVGILVPPFGAIIGYF